MWKAKSRVAFTQKLNGGSEKRRECAVKKLRFLTILLVVVFFSYQSIASSSTKAVIIFSSDIEPYQAISRGFKEFLFEKKVSLKSTVYNVSKQDTARILQGISRDNPELVLTVGHQASKLAREKIHTIPVVFSGVLNYKEMKGANITGVSLEAPAPVKLKQLKKILPHVKTIGMIYSPKSMPFYKEALKGFQGTGFRLIGKKIHADREFPLALKAISRQIDSFMMIPDTNVYFPQSIKYLLLECLRENLPVIGLSSAYTKAGAFLSFESNYHSLGRQAGAIAYRILQGEKPTDVPPSKPEEITFSLNLQVAKRLGMKIPNTIINEASEVFE